MIEISVERKLPRLLPKFALSRLIVLLQKSDRTGLSIHISLLILCGYQVDQTNMTERVGYDVEITIRDHDR